MESKEKTILKRIAIILSNVFCCVIVALFISLLQDSNHVEAASRTQDEAVAWALAQNGQQIDLDGKNGNQCVDLIAAYYEYLGYGRVWGNGYDYDEGGKYCPDGWTYVSSPLPGDIAISNVAPYGHVAIVTSGSGDNYSIMEQNYNWSGICKPRNNLNRSSFEKYLRPDFICYLDLNWYLDGKEVISSYFGTADVYIKDKLVEANSVDYYTAWPLGTKYEFKNIKAKDGYEYVGVQGNLQGKLSGSILKVYLKFETKNKKQEQEKEKGQSVSSDWIQSSTGTWTYWAIPAGFDKNHALYSKYQGQKLESSETATKKVVAEAPVQSGWIYYHWTSNSYERSNYNIYISREYKWEGSREYYNFRAFESVNDHGHTDQNGVYGGDDVYYSWGDNPEDGSWWWFRIPLYKQTYTTYEKAAKQEYYIDLNWTLDGKEASNPSYASVDVYIDGKKVSTGAKEYCVKWPDGTKYEFKNLKLSDGYELSGYTGNLKGTVGNSGVTTCYNIKTKKTTTSTPTPTPTPTPISTPEITPEPDTEPEPEPDIETTTVVKPDPEETAKPATTQKSKESEEIDDSDVIIDNSYAIEEIVVEETEEIDPDDYNFEDFEDDIFGDEDSDEYFDEEEEEENRLPIGTVIKIKNGPIYKVTDIDEVTVTGINSTTATTLTIPASIVIDDCEYEVYTIKKNAFKNNKKLKRVTIKADLVSIEEGAFTGCKALERLDLNGDIDAIERKAFYNCPKLKQIYITTDVIPELGSKAFGKVYSKVAVKVPAGMVAEYKKVLKKAGLPSKAVVK